MDESLNPLEALQQGSKSRQRWAAFVLEYVKEFSIKNAAVAANYTYDSARHVLGRKEVRKAINFLVEDAGRTTNVTPEVTLKELSIAAFFDPSSLFDGDGQLLKISELPPEVTKAISSIDVVTKLDDDGVSVSIAKIRFVDKLGALNTIARHLNMFKEENKSSIVALSDILNQIDGSSKGLPEPVND